MNFGFFGFPSKDNPRILDIREFDTSGIYVVPNGARAIYAFAVAGGGGGGGGGRRAVGTNSFGGGSGSGGAQFIGFLPEEVVAIPGVSIQVTIGAGSAGGAAAAANDTSGSGANNGGDTSLAYKGLGGIYGQGEWHTFLYLLGGGGGAGGSNIGGNAGSVRTSLILGSLTTNVAGSSGNTNADVFYVVESPAYNAGGGGCGVNGTNNLPGVGGRIIVAAENSLYPVALYPYSEDPGLTPGATAFAGGGTDGGAAGQSANRHIFTNFSSGFGGAGGGGGATAAASNGGNGYRGGGGGGGGGARNTFAAGAGGKGGDGYVIFAALR
jgi:hypothetical protein